MAQLLDPKHGFIARELLNVDINSYTNCNLNNTHYASYVIDLALNPASTKVVHVMENIATSEHSL